MFGSGEFFNPNFSEEEILRRREDFIDLLSSILRSERINESGKAQETITRIIQELCQVYVETYLRDTYSELITAERWLVDEPYQPGIITYYFVIRERSLSIQRHEEETNPNLDIILYAGIRLEFSKDRYVLKAYKFPSQNTKYDPSHVFVDDNFDLNNFPMIEIELLKREHDGQFSIDSEVSPHANVSSESREAVDLDSISSLLTDAFGEDISIDETTGQKEIKPYIFYRIGEFLHDSEFPES